MGVILEVSFFSLLTMLWLLLTPIQKQKLSTSPAQKDDQTPLLNPQKSQIYMVNDGVAG